MYLEEIRTNLVSQKKQSFLITVRHLVWSDSERSFLFFSTKFWRMCTRTGVSGRTGNCLWGKIFQKELGGVVLYDWREGISGHFFFVAGLGRGGGL